MEADMAFEMASPVTGAMPMAPGSRMMRGGRGGRGEGGGPAGMPQMRKKKMRSLQADTAMPPPMAMAMSAMAPKPQSLSTGGPPPRRQLVPSTPEMSNECFVK
eukprot:scaffold100_cov82-Cylindrotheca_fusiformis.AAC.1